MKWNDIVSWTVVLGLMFSISSCNPENIKPSPVNYIIDGPQDTDPAFSPDGNYIAYVHWQDTAPDYPNGLYVINKNGGDKKLVIKGTWFNSPSWSPDGQWLVFSSGQLMKCKINGDSLTMLTALSGLEYPEFYFPSWTKDGKRILFDKPLGSDWGIYSCANNLSEASRFSLPVILGRNPELSLDQQYVVYEAGDGGGTDVQTSEIFLREVATSKKIQLTSNGRDNKAATWSPDGKKITWSSSLRLSVMNEDGTAQTEIGYGSSPSWSVNNDIVFSHANASYTKEVLYIILQDGTNQKQITF